MPFFPSVPKEERLAYVLARFNTGVEKPLMELHQVLLRGEDSPLSVAQRELIAAYVSGVANCQYCSGIHAMIAEQFGMEEGLIRDLLEDVDSADIEDNFKPILKYVKKVTLEPTKLLHADVDAVFDAGWSERALYDALMVCCTFNFVNRFVSGIGLDVNLEGSKKSSEMLVDGYAQIIDKLGLK